MGMALQDLYEEGLSVAKELGEIIKNAFVSLHAKDNEVIGKYVLVLAIACLLIFALRLLRSEVEEYRDREGNKSRKLPWYLRYWILFLIIIILYAILFVLILRWFGRWPNIAMQRHSVYTRYGTMKAAMTCNKAWYRIANKASAWLFHSAGFWKYPAYSGNVSVQLYKWSRSQQQ